jgi:hypothetical protein
MMSEKEILMLKTGTLESRKRLIEVLRIAHDPNLSFEQAIAKVRATRAALDAQKSHAQAIGTVDIKNKESNK